MITTYKGIYWITFNNYGSSVSKRFVYNKVKTLFYIPNIFRYFKCLINHETYYNFYGLSINLIKITTRSSYKNSKYMDTKKEALDYLSKNGFIIMKKICSLDNGDVLSSAPYNEHVAYENMENTMRMLYAYNSSGEYVGDPEFALYLLKRGIVPEKSDPSHSVCSIGFCTKDQKWYGWSHRALFGFGIGSQVTRKCCGFKPATKEEFVQSVIEFYGDEGKLNKDFVITDEGVVIKSGTIEHIERYPKEFGKGEWTAATLEDAKEMAIDFADGVS